MLPLPSLLFLSGLFTGASCLIKEQPLCCASPGSLLAVAVEPNGRMRCGCCREEAKWPRAWGWRGVWQASGKGMASLLSLPEPSEQGQPGQVRWSRVGAWRLPKGAPLQILAEGSGTENRALIQRSSQTYHLAQLGSRCIHRGWRKERGGNRNMSFYGTGSEEVPTTVQFPSKRTPVLVMVLTPSSGSRSFCLLGTQLPSRCLSHWGAHSSSSY